MPTFILIFLYLLFKIFQNDYKIAIIKRYKAIQDDQR
jgi:hypothetical protein